MTVESDGEIPKTITLWIDKRGVDAKLLGVHPPEFLPFFSIVSGVIIGPTNPQGADGFVLGHSIIWQEDMEKEQGQR